MLKYEVLCVLAGEKVGADWFDMTGAVEFTKSEKQT